MCIGITWKSDSMSMKWQLRFCASSKLPSEVSAAWFIGHTSEYKPYFSVFCCGGIWSYLLWDFSPFGWLYSSSWVSIWFPSYLWNSGLVRLHVLTKWRVKSPPRILHLLLIIFLFWFQCPWGPNPQQSSSSWGLPVRLAEYLSHIVAEICFLFCTFILTIKCPSL